ncbi:hypothetical protein GCM10018966_015650 [Streptomyces yanii]
MTGEAYVGLRTGTPGGPVERRADRTGPGDVLEAGGGRCVGAEDADALPCGLDEVGVAAAPTITDWYRTSSSAT